MKKSRKHIAFVVKYFPTISETFIVNQINALIESGYTVDLYSYNKLEESIIHESINKYKLQDRVHYFTKPSNSKLLRFITCFYWIVYNFWSIRWKVLFKSFNIIRFGKEALTLKLFYESQWFLNKRPYEVIHAHFGMNANRIAYLLHCGIIPKKTRLITTFHGYDLLPNQTEVYKIKYAFLLEYGTVFTVNTPYLEQIFKNVNHFEKPCHVLPVGLDTSVFKRNAKQELTVFFNILFCGKLSELKGPDIAISVLAKLIEQGYKRTRLNIVGSGQLLYNLKKQVQDLGIADFVNFIGNLSQEELLNMYRQTDVFILPGRYEETTGRGETQGLVIQEAQAMNIPVIVSDVGGIKYGMINNSTGFLIEEENILGFVAAIEKLILDPDLKLQMGISGRKFVENKYDIKILSKELESIYNSC